MMKYFLSLFSLISLFYQCHSFKIFGGPIKVVAFENDRATYCGPALDAPLPAGMISADIKNVDGYLTLTCEISQCWDLQKEVPQCQNQWLPECPPLHFVSQWRPVFFRNIMKFQVKCCSYTAFTQENYIGDYDRTLQFGNQEFNAVPQDVRGPVVQYVENIYTPGETTPGARGSLFRVRDKYMMKVGQIKCTQTTTTTTTTPRTPRRDHTDHPTHQNAPPPMPGAEGAAGSAPMCFGPDNKVQTRTGIKRMDELKVGDEVLTSLWDGTISSYQPITYFLHRNPHISATFTNITTENGLHLSLSPEHLLPIFDCSHLPKSKSEFSRWFTRNARFAKKAAPGLCVLGRTEADDFVADPIVSVSEGKGYGIYSPVTPTGIIVVDGIQTSCYSTVENHMLQHAFFSSLSAVTGTIENLLSFIIPAPLADHLSDNKQDIPTMVKLMQTVFNLVSGV